MKIIAALLAGLAAVTAAGTLGAVEIQNGCVSFSVGAGTGCAWMCNYCAGALGTNNYYFTDGVCTYESGVGCVGSPQTGVTYTCCAAGEEAEAGPVVAATEEGECEETTVIIYRKRNCD